MTRMDELEQEQRLIANNRAALKVLSVGIKVKCRECKSVEMQIFTILPATYVLTPKA